MSEASKQHRNSIHAIEKIEKRFGLKGSLSIILIKIRNWKIFSNKDVLHCDITFMIHDYHGNAKQSQFHHCIFLFILIKDIGNFS